MWRSLAKSSLIVNCFNYTLPLLFGTKNIVFDLLDVVIFCSGRYEIRRNASEICYINHDQCWKGKMKKRLIELMITWMLLMILMSWECQGIKKLWDFKYVHHLDHSLFLWARFKIYMNFQPTGMGSYPVPFSLLEEESLSDALAWYRTYIWCQIFQNHTADQLILTFFKQLYSS